MKYLCFCQVKHDEAGYQHLKTDGPGFIQASAEVVCEKAKVWVPLVRARLLFSMRGQAADRVPTYFSSNQPKRVLFWKIFTRIATFFFCFFFVFFKFFGHQEHLAVTSNRDSKASNSYIRIQHRDIYFLFQYQNHVVDPTPPPTTPNNPRKQHCSLITKNGKQTKKHSRLAPLTPHLSNFVLWSIHPNIQPIK